MNNFEEVDDGLYEPVAEKMRSRSVNLRKSPAVSATIFGVGMKMLGNDGNMWIIVENCKGIKRWQKLKAIS